LENNYSLSQWFRDPPTKSYADLDSVGLNQVKQAVSLFYPWKWISDEKLYDSIYYAFDASRMFIQYPAHITAFWNWTRTNDT